MTEESGRSDEQQEDDEDEAQEERRLGAERGGDDGIDDYYVRYAREIDPVKRKAIAKEFQEFMADKLYWNNISGSPFYMVTQPYVKGYVYNAEFEVHWDTVWLDK